MIFCACNAVFLAQQSYVVSAVDHFSAELQRIITEDSCCQGECVVVQLIARKACSR